MIGLEVTGMVEAEQTYKRLRDGVDRAAYVSLETTAEHLARMMADASPIGSYDEPGHQPVPRRPGELAESWHVVALNQYSVAVISTVWYAKLMLFEDVEKDEWTIERAGGGESSGGPGNQKGDIARSFSDKGMNLYFQGHQDGSLMLLPVVTRHAQETNKEMQQALKDGEAEAQMMTRNLFGSAIQDYVRIR